MEGREEKEGLAVRIANLPFLPAISCEPGDDDAGNVSRFPYFGDGIGFLIRFNYGHGIGDGGRGR